MYIGPSTLKQSKDSKNKRYSPSPPFKTQDTHNAATVIHTCSSAWFVLNMYQEVIIKASFDKQHNKTRLNLNEFCQSWILYFCLSTKNTIIVFYTTLNYLNTFFFNGFIFCKCILWNTYYVHGRLFAKLVSKGSACWCNT